MKAFISEETSSILQALLRSASAFADQDRPIMEICHSILQLDAIVQFLVEYIET
jgi:hypothetical protein